VSAKPAELNFESKPFSEHPWQTPEGFVGTLRYGYNGSQSGDPEVLLIDGAQHLTIEDGRPTVRAVSRP
jgi:hypothetical protein